MFIQINKSSDWDLGAEVVAHLLEIDTDGKVLRLIQVDGNDHIIDLSPSEHNPYEAVDYPPLSMESDWSEWEISPAKFEAYWNREIDLRTTGLSLPLRSALTERSTKEMKETDLARTFQSIAKAFFTRFPNLNPKWITDSTWADLELEIPSQKESGFDVFASIQGDEITVFGGGCSHQHLNLESDTERLASEAFGLIYDLLSPGMRVIEFTAGGKPYKWKMQTQIDGEWHTDIITGLMCWRLFSKKAQRVLQNDLVPLREVIFV